MPTILSENHADSALPIHVVRKGAVSELPEAFSGWARAVRFKGDAGAVVIVPGRDGRPAAALLGIGDIPERGDLAADRKRRALLAGSLAKALPAGDWTLVTDPTLDPEIAALAVELGGYRFSRYLGGGRPQSETTAKDDDEVRIHFGDVDVASVRETASAVRLVRDLVNTPTSDMGPAELETAARELASRFGASVRSIEGEALLTENFPMIHAVGRASTSAPRLLDMTWGGEGDPKVTLVGKGVCFDTGGLDIKPASGMLLMKKDMGGAAHALGLAQLVMASGLKVRLRVLIPAVENSISGNAFRPGDILRARSGRTVEVGNTDAEGRLVLADALVLGDEEAPEIMIDMATLTGAARVALGAELPAFFTNDDSFAADMERAGSDVADPVWRMPLWQPYRAGLASRVADTSNVTSDGFAGAITAALFLEDFVKQARSWSHLDIYAWRTKAAAHGPAGGEAYAIRALHRVLKDRYGS